MAIIRVAFRAAGFLITTIGLYSLHLVGRGLCLVLRRDPTPWRIKVVRTWARSCATIIGLNIEVEGTPPKSPFFMVSNHLSYVDILPYFMLMDCVFVAKGEVRSWPMLGSMAEGINVIFINREMKRDIPRVNNLIKNNINDRQGIVIFPEGTTTKGDRVATFNSSLLKYAASQNFPVSYASITYRTPDTRKPAHKWICWWGDMTFVDHFLRLLTLSSIEAVVTFGDQQITAKNRKVLAQKLEQQVRQQFKPTVKDKQENHG